MSDSGSPASPRPENERISPGDASAGEIEIMRSFEAARGPTNRFFKDSVRILGPDGYVESVQVRLRHTEDNDDGIVIAPIRDDGRIVLIRQFRHATRMWMRELPRGGRKRGEAVNAAAAREISEEIGYEVTATRPLGRIAADGADLESVPYIVAARVKPAGKPHREDTETIDRTFLYTFHDLEEAARNGAIIDGYTIAAVLRLQPFFREDRPVDLW
jgi:ADP-ribose pyrophosphatase